MSTQTLNDLWLSLLQNCPHKPVLTDAATQISWTISRLHSSAIPLAAEIKKHKLVSAPIAFQSGSCAEWWIHFIAIQLANAVAIPLDPDTPTSQIPEILRQLQCNTWLENNTIRLCENSPAISFPDDICLAKITSGSTGTPKAIYFTHSEMIADGRQIIEGMGIRADDINYATIPLGHSYGLGNLVMPLLLAGIPIIACSGYFPNLMAAEMNATKATVWPTVPALIRAVVHTEEIIHLPYLRLVISAGSALPTALAVQFLQRFNIPVHNFLGSSETGGIAFHTTGILQHDEASVGQPLPCVRIEVLDNHQLAVHSNAVFTYQNPFSTTHTFHTPDLGFLDDQHNLCLTGRLRSFLKIGSRRLHPGEIEKLAVQSGYVDFAWVSTFQTGDRHRLGILFTGNFEPAQLKQYLKQNLPSWKVPSRIRKIETIPQTARGKTQATQLQQLLDM